MPQLRLEHYFTPTQPPFLPSGRGFLDLPRSARKRIYEYAGLDNSFVDLNYSNLKVYARGMYPDTSDCIKITSDEDWYDVRMIDAVDSDDIWESCEDYTPGAYEMHEFSVWNRRFGIHQSLLLASKGVHEDVEALIYAGTTFRVCLGQPLGFKRLWRMSDNALSYLTSLTIRLDTPRTTVKSSVWDGVFLSPPTPINLSLKWGKLIYKEWTSILERLARFIRPSQLRLSVVFRAKTIEDARMILQPIAQLPPLKDCAICADVYGQDFWRWQQCNYNFSRYDERWNPKETAELPNLVQRIIQIVTKRPLPGLVFRYLDLPQELRLAILEFTDLVSSDAVQWRPRSEQGYPRVFYHCTECGGRGTIGDQCICYGSGLSEAGEYDNEYNMDSCCTQCRLEDHPSICYCSRHGSIWSSSCKCLLPRHPLFSVSSQIRQEATQVYYTRNKILITPFYSPILRLVRNPYGPGPAFWGFQDIPKLELSLYLSSIAPNALQHIRWLEWVIPAHNPNYLLPKSPAWYDYLDTLLLMQNAMNLSALTLTIIFKPAAQERYKALDENRWRWYKTIILPLQRLGETGLKDFFVYARWYDDTRGLVAHREKDLERAVMGNGYNSDARGKPEDRLWRVTLDFWARQA